jgi:hypothetical protein
MESPSEIIAGDQVRREKAEPIWVRNRERGRCLVDGSPFRVSVQCVQHQITQGYIWFVYLDPRYVYGVWERD